MKIVAINGSPRKNGNTALCLEAVRKEVEAAGVEFQVFQPGASGSTHSSRLPNSDVPTTPFWRRMRSASPAG